MIQPAKLKTTLLLGLAVACFGSACRHSDATSQPKDVVIGEQSVDLGSYVVTADDHARFRTEYEARTGKAFCEAVQTTLDHPVYRNPASQLYPLPPEEVFAIRGYTLFDFKPINAALRSGDQAELAKYKHEILNIASGLGRLPQKARRLYRGASLSEDIVAKYVEAANSGQPLVEKGFSSTSMDLEVGWSYGLTGQLFVIHAKRGGLIELLSEFPSEREVLLVPGSTFKVVRVAEVGAGELRLQAGQLESLGAPPATTAPAHPIDGCPALALADGPRPVRAPGSPAPFSGKFFGALGFDDSTADNAAPQGFSLGISGDGDWPTTQMIIEMEEI